MPRNIVLCCDGTANEFATDRTNVIKLFATLVHEPARQVTYYYPGVGTMEPPGALTKFSRAVTKVLGQAIEVASGRAQCAARCLVLAPF